MRTPWMQARRGDLPAQVVHDSRVIDEDDESGMDMLRPRVREELDSQ